MLDNRQGIPAFTLLFLPTWFKPLASTLKSFSMDEMSAKLSQQELLELTFYGKGSPLSSYFTQGSLYDYWLTQTKFDNTYIQKLEALKRLQRDVIKKPELGNHTYTSTLETLQKEKLFFVFWLTDDDMQSFQLPHNVQHLMSALFEQALGFMPLDVVVRSFTSVFPFFINELRSGDK